MQPQVDVLNAKISVRKAEQALATAEEALADSLSGADSVESSACEGDAECRRRGPGEGPRRPRRAGSRAGCHGLAAAKADVDAKKLALADAETALTCHQPGAPFDGTILQVGATAGDRISSGTAILTIADLTGLEVLASVDETTIKSITAGQSARDHLRRRSRPDAERRGRQHPAQGALQGDVMVYEVPVSLHGAQNLSLMVGMTANVNIATGEGDRALLVPTMALTRSGGMYQVQVLDSTGPDAVPQSVPVQIGLSNGTYTQITAGLNEGDRVVVKLSGSNSTASQNQSGATGSSAAA